MNKTELTRQILNARAEHKKPTGIALNIQYWQRINLEIHQIQHIEDVPSDPLAAMKFMGIHLFIKDGGLPEFLYGSPNDMIIELNETK